ncbi:MAG: carbon starvation protein A [Elusimicrobiota bacterium]|jgi:carbon starvation protein|nr:carbon starvation protein A [Elusimicrobiota bacterium]
MNGLVMLVVSAVVLFIAYIFYGRYLANKWGIDPKRKTPAYEFEDDVDYVPTSPSVVFGHQFASIAGAGPINGPIIAAMFGWLPVLLWIIIGGIFFGAVQDLASLYASVRNKGKTIGYIIELYIGRTGKNLFLIFVWLFSILVVAAFADIVAGTFAGFDAAGVGVKANASVASTSSLFVVAAVFLGLFIRKRKPGGLFSAVIAVILLSTCVAFGIFFPLYIGKAVWLYLVFAYVLIASVTPIWALIQPRDYLNSFLLVAMIAASFIGIIFARPSINIPAFSGFVINGQYLFPILFVTVACGAVSGFHSLVASGTTSKQINNEKYILPISYGAMLVECLLAVIALIAVGSLAVGGKLPQGTPPMIFANATASFLSGLGLGKDLVYTLITLSISAFALTSLDSVARVGRLAFQEFFISEGKLGPVSAFFSNKITATICTLLLGYSLAIVGYQNIWPLFGSANQLLAALALISCAVFLKRTNRQGTALYAPMIIMLAVTFTALFFTIKAKWAKLFGDGEFLFALDGLQLIFAVLLLVLGIIVAAAGLSKITSKPKQTA